MLCQHYGIPTRLLDWTHDICIALFFACENEMDVDGALFLCDESKYPKFPSYSQDLKEIQNLFFINSYIVNPRVRSQAGAFMIWGHSPLNDKTTESYDLSSYIAEKKIQHNIHKLSIPAKCKQKILNELSGIYGVSKESIYLQGTSLEKEYSNNFDFVKDNIRLMTLYETDSKSLNTDEKNRAKQWFNIDCQDMIAGCVNLTRC